LNNTRHAEANFGLHAHPGGFFIFADPNLAKPFVKPGSVKM
jgi:hypothetical protein